jgi:hypothetical protein
MIEIPHIARLDVELLMDIKFYSRFFAIYVSKMKKDWARIDNDLSGRGMKKARDDYELKNILRWSRETEKRNKHLSKHPEDDDQVRDGMCEVSKQMYKEKIQKQKKMRRKKRYRKLWGNCVPLSNYKGCFIINQEMVLDRRRRRYQEDTLIYNEHKCKKENVIQATFKDDTLKSFYDKTYERKQENLDCERDARTFDQSSAVDESDVTAENEYSTQNRICKQNSIVECTNNFVIGTTSLTSGTNPEIFAEEVISFKGFGTYYEIRDIYPFVSSYLRRKMKNSLIESKWFIHYNSDCECEEQTINHSSAVDGSGAAADSENSCQKRICKQNPAIECTPNLENATI